MATGMVAVAIDRWEEAEAFLAGIDFPDKEHLQYKLWVALGMVGHLFKPEVSISALEKALALLLAQGNVQQLSARMKRVMSLVRRLPAGVRQKIDAKLRMPPPTYEHHRRRGLANWLPPAPNRWMPEVMKVHVYLSIASGLAGWPEKGIAVAQRALALLPFPGTVLEGGMLATLSGNLALAGRFDESEPLNERARALLLAEDPATMGEMLGAMVGAIVGWMSRTQAGERFDGELLQQGLDIAESKALLGSRCLLRGVASMWYAWTGRAAETEVMIEAIVGDCRRNSAPLHPAVLYLRPYLLWSQGDFAEARAHVQRAYRYVNLAPDAIFYQLVRLLDAQIYISVGDLQAALPIVDDVLATVRESGLGMLLLRALTIRSELLRALGDWEGAQTLLQEAHDKASQGPLRNPICHAIAARHLAANAIEKRDWDTAKALLSEAMAIVTRPEQDNLIEQAHLYQAMGALALAQGDPSTGKNALMASAEIFHLLGNRFHQRIVARQLDALSADRPVQRAQGPTADVPAAVERTTWQDSWLAATVDFASQADVYEALLLHCMSVSRADAGSVFITLPEITWACSRNREGPSHELPMNHDFVGRAVSSGQAVVAIDMPGDMAQDGGSNMGAELASVLVYPVLLAGQHKAVLYLVRHGLEEPFEDGDATVIGDLCDAAADSMNRVGLGTPAAP
jgi:tetratricopeptide (TPR) repeat protein